MADSIFRLTTGAVSVEGGVNSGVLPTIVSEANPNGLGFNQLAWLINATVRGGAIYPRPGVKKLAAMEIDAGLFQEAKMYEPDNGNPYIIIQVGGRTYWVRVDTDNSIAELTYGGPTNDPLLPQSWMCQAEQFMVIQDGVAEPLVFDGIFLRRVGTMLNTSPKIPTAECMCYYMGRLWLALGREYVASDIVQGPSGTGTITPPAGYEKRDSVLSMTENTYVATGGTFRVPTNAGNIRAMDFSANLDTALGQGQLFVFTREQIYSVNVVPTRVEWITQTEPIQKIAQITFGATSDRSITRINGDLFFRSMDGVRSQAVAVRNFGQWANVPISKEETRAIKYDDRGLLRYTSGIQFNNRLLQTVGPYQTDVGVAFRGLMPLDFDVLGSLAKQLAPVWEGVWEGLDLLRVLQADFGGLQRAFAIVHSRITGGIEIWEITSSELRDNGDNRIAWVVETPSYTWGNPFVLKELDTMNLWIDRIYGEVDVIVKYREGQNPCWRDWHAFKLCATRNECEVEGYEGECEYPRQVYSEQYRAPLTLPKAKGECDTTNKRPSNLGYSFQVRLEIKGSCELRGWLLHAIQKDQAPYQGITC